MQLVQIFTFSFFLPFLISSPLLFFGLHNGLVIIGFHLYAFLTVVCDLYPLNPNVLDYTTCLGASASAGKPTEHSKKAEKQVEIALRDSTFITISCEIHKNKGISVWRKLGFHIADSYVGVFSERFGTS
jgi:hypothetical protein